MRALPNDKWRRFAEVYADQGQRRAGPAARAAGFACGSLSSARVQGHRLLADERMRAAIVELCRGRLASLAPSAISVTEAVMHNERSTGAERTKAAQMILDRSGLHAVSEVKNTLYLGDDPDQVRRIGQMCEVLAASLGVPAQEVAAALLGRRLAAALPAMIEGEAVDVTPTPRRLDPAPAWKEQPGGKRRNVAED